MRTNYSYMFQKNTDTKESAIVWTELNTAVLHETFIESTQSLSTLDRVNTWKNLKKGSGGWSI